ncbi:MAG TPA: hypothetical protein VGG19_13035 [Tepidisphaeraceae bacterium]
MSPQLRKEIRCLLPATLASLVIPICVQLCLGRMHYRANDSVPIFALFVTLVAASSFGVELREGTLGMLLTQPIRRRKLWLFKSVVLGGALIIVFASYAFSTTMPAREYPLLFLLVLCAFGMTPWLTLKFRDGLIAAVTTLIVEWVIVILAFQMFRWRTLHPDEMHLSGGRYAWTIIAAIVCSIFGWIAGYRALLGWQGAAAQNRARIWIVMRMHGGAQSRTRRRRSASLSLVRKELRLHSINLVLAAGFCLPFVAFLWYSGPEQDALNGWFKFYSFVFPISVGAVTVASERQWGVLEGQLTLPVAVGRQWKIKLGTCFALSFIGGILIPWMLLCARTALHPATNHHWFKVVDYSTEVLIFTALAVLSSSVVRGTLRAVILGFSVAFASLIFYGWIVDYFGASELAHVIVHHLQRANPLLINSYSLAGVALVAMMFIVQPAFDRFRQPGNQMGVVYLTMRTVLLLAILRFALLFMPAVSI